ncbi:Multistep phosphorelay regulator 1 [Erysiphe necator]|uniref:Putative hpt domain-containing protein n=1 Tax=Uncinula necator TaxID=52586 RepID=A0A0B1P8L8_UNCNE|nr:Multistep phosphorelay regulator 1 [Erysiphe necator]KHJ33009.1 putative hpt domain-containing protein [Erysiphe necator]
MSDSHNPRESEAENVENAEGSTGLYDWGDNVDTSTFEQILEMDDDEEEREFSRSIVIGFFEQAETTFTQIEAALESKDLPKLSSLGHFLKGSSATLGLTKVKNSCEKIQHFGQKKDQEGIADEDDEDKCLKRIEETFQTLKKDYVEAVNILKTFFGINSQDGSTTEDEQIPKTVTSLISTVTKEEDEKEKEATTILTPVVTSTITSTIVSLET